MSKRLMLCAVIGLCLSSSLHGTGPVTIGIDGYGPIGAWLPASLRVSANGSTVGGVPLPLPSGLSGMNPGLGLSYSSNGGNGILGVGFRLSGLPAITRCGQRMDIDGDVTTVQYDSYDRFCLNGQRMILESGIYGAAGSIYRFNPESQVRVVAHGNHVSGPEYFEVWSPNGSVSTYQGFERSKGTPDPVPHQAWLLTYAKNSVGNDMTIEYTNDNNGEILPSVLRYGGHTSASMSQAPFIEVHFEYIDRALNDTYVKYQGGHMITQSKLLSAIEAQVDGQPVYRYILNYEQSIATRRARLTDVTPCGYAPDKHGVLTQECGPPTQFVWAEAGEPQLLEDTVSLMWEPGADSDFYVPGGLSGSVLSPTGASGLTVGAAPGAETAWSGFGPAGGPMGHNTATPGDANNNGRADLVLMRKSGTQTVADVFASDGTDLTVLHSGLALAHDWDKASNAFTQADIDGDGDQDLIVFAVDNDDTVAKIYLSDETSTLTYHSTSWLMDEVHRTLTETKVKFYQANINGDEKLDLLALRYLDPVLDPYSATPDYVVDGFTWDGSQFVKMSVSKNVGAHAVDYEIPIVTDITGDGLTDLVWVAPGSSAFGIQIDVYAGTTLSSIIPLSHITPSPVTLPGFGAFTGLQHFLVMPSDVNGDGKQDLLFIHEYDDGTGTNKAKLEWIYSTGDGTQFMPHTGSGLVLGRWGALGVRIHTGDFNGDGRTDLATFQQGPSPGVSLWVSTGSYFEEVTNASPLDTNGPVLLDIVLAPQDVSGDGKTDIVRIGAPNDEPLEFDLFQYQMTGEFISESILALDPLDYPSWISALGDSHDYFTNVKVDSVELRTYLASGGPTDVIVDVIQGNGHTTRVNYVYATSDDGTYSGHTDLIGHPSSTRSDRRRLIASSILSQDGISGWFQYDYQYSGGKQDLYQGSLGFEAVERFDPQSLLRSNTTYHQIFPRTGLVSGQTTELDGGVVISDTNYVWGIWNAGLNWHVRLEQSHTQSYEITGGQIGDSTTTLSGFDVYDNPGTIQTVNSAHTTTITKTYDNIDTPTQLILGLPISSTVTVSLPAGLGVPDQGVYFDRTFDPVTGLTTQFSQDYLDVGGVDKTRSVSFDYDDYGNVTTTTTTADSSSRISHVSYDTRGRFANTATNELGQTATIAVDERLGVPSSVTSIAGVTASFNYDAYGRMTKMIAPTGVEIEQFYEYRYLSPLPGTVSEIFTPDNAITRIRAQGDTIPISLSYSDLLGRPVHSVVKNFNNIWSAISQRYSYTPGSSMVEFSLPYNDGETPVWTANVITDNLGRPVQSTDADGAVTTLSYHNTTSGSSPLWGGGAYPGYKRATVLQTPVGQTFVSVVNENGQLIQTIDQSGYSSTALYDGFGQTLAQADAGINLTTMSYDTLGRLTSQSDPNKAAPALAQYNGFNEPTQLTTPKGDVITFDYDDLGRLTQRISPEGLTSWIYDNVTGYLDSVNNPVADHEYYYDALGRATTQITAVHSTPAGISPAGIGGTFMSQAQYDTYGRPQQIDYPGGFSLEMIYDGPYLESIRNANDPTENYWTLLATDALGRIEAEQLSQQMVTQYGYHPTKLSLQSIHTTGHPNIVQDLFYETDAIGRVTKRQDNLLSVHDTFAYDVRNQLTHMDNFDSSGLRYSKSYTYDALGNMLDHDGVAMTYGDSGYGPHAVTSANFLPLPGIVTYDYDASGNMTSDSVGSFNVTYTSFDKPAFMTTPGQQIRMDYDSAYRRIRDIEMIGSTVTETVELGPYQHIHHQSTGEIEQRYSIRGGGRMIAVRTDSSIDGVSTSYLHHDNQNTLDKVTDRYGLVEQAFSRLPFGQPREADWTLGIPSDPSSEVTDRGYTGHRELLDYGGGIIHMGGRIYHLPTARMMNVDPVSLGLDSISLNGYAYVRNNPATLTDPSGYSPCPPECGDNPDYNEYVHGPTNMLDSVTITPDPDPVVTVSPISLVNSWEEALVFAESQLYNSYYENERQAQMYQRGVLGALAGGTISIEPDSMEIRRQWENGDREAVAREIASPTQGIDPVYVEVEVMDMIYGSRGSMKIVGEVVEQAIKNGGRRGFAHFDALRNNPLFGRDTTPPTYRPRRMLRPGDYVEVRQFETVNGHTVTFVDLDLEGSLADGNFVRLVENATEIGIRDSDGIILDVGGFKGPLYENVLTAHGYTIYHKSMENPRMYSDLVGIIAVRTKEGSLLSKETLEFIANSLLNPLGNP